ncbi:MAG: hypothetical protein OIF38_03580 [Cellvibrionaceae bacterium]|nr:hypothetical protein [Cellvibrionaceae bacterium]
MSYLQKLVLLLTVLGLYGCGSSEPVISHCEPVDGRTPLCGLHNPEDIEPLPGGRHLLLSQMGIVGQHSPGSLAIFDTQTEQLQVLGPFTQPPTERWGQPNCQPPGQAFSPHGIHLSSLGQGRQRLLVVNHGGRESVEGFTLEQAPEGFKLVWQGCVEQPSNSYINDVVAAPEGGFFSTHMFAREGIGIGPLKLPHIMGMLGANTGWVWHWQADKGFSEVPGYRSANPNGIQISADGQTLFVNSWGGNRVDKLDWRNGQLLASVEVSHPDNSQWGPDGRLLVASQSFNLAQANTCMQVRSGACPSPFKVVAINPQTMAAEVLLEQAGAPMGAGTVAQVLGQHLYIGTFAGDRLLRTPWPPQ